MVNILIVKKNLQYGTQITNEISKTNQDLRFCGIVSSSDEFIKYINDFTIDILLVDLEFFTESNKITLNSYKNAIIIISHTQQLIKKEYDDT